MATFQKVEQCSFSFSFCFTKKFFLVKLKMSNLQEFILANLRDYFLKFKLKKKIALFLQSIV